MIHLTLPPGFRRDFNQRLKAFHGQWHWTFSVILVLGLCGCRTPHSDSALTDGSHFLNPASYNGPVRVACIGDSITYGDGIQNREANHYPYFLGQCLGSKFETRNFGVNGATLSKQGDLPYWTTGAFQQATDYAPHAIVIKLGTNDTKPQNWRDAASFQSDLESMLAHFQQLESNPRVWLCLPVPAHGERWGIRNEIIENEIIPAIRQTAAKLSLPVIDLYALMTDRAEMFPDQIHPDASGAALIAQAVCYELVDKHNSK